MCAVDDPQHTPPYRSLDLQAPLRLLTLTKSLCAEILAGAAPSQSFASSTILVSYHDLVGTCFFSPIFTNPGYVYYSLTQAANASAIILVEDHNIPGLYSKAGAPTPAMIKYPTRQARVRQCSAPFASIGYTAGKLLFEQLEANPHDDVHVEFAFDRNLYQVMYDDWLGLFFVFTAGTLSVSALYKMFMVGVLPSFTTKGLVILFEMPAVLSLLIFTIRGPLFFGNTPPQLTLACGAGFTTIGLTSKILVARFWIAYDKQFKDVEGSARMFVDPIHEEPLTSLAIIFVGFATQAYTSWARIHFAVHNTGDPLHYTPIIMAVLFLLSYFLTSVYFSYAAVNVLLRKMATRELAGSDKRARRMAVYQLVSAAFMIMHLVSLGLYAARFTETSEIAYGLIFTCLFMSRGGTALCCVSIFHVTAESLAFLELQNAQLAEDVERLEQERKRDQMKQHNAKLYTRSLEAEREVERQREAALKMEVLHKSVLLKQETDFTATALHEIRNPLNGIVQIVEYLMGPLKNELTPNVATELRSIVQCSDHLLLFLKNVLSLDKILSGTMALPCKAFNPAELCQAVKTMSKHSVQQGVTIEAVCEEAEVVLCGAPLQLNLMLLNLMSNAAKNTAQGRIVLGATVVRETGNVVDIKFSVTDTGPGIPVDMQKGIFGMRSQTGGVAEQSKGFGIGLNIASKLAVLMGSELLVKSPVADGKGSEFSFTMSLEKGEFTEGEDEAVEKVEPPVGLRVLVVDDMEMNRKLLKRRLEVGVFKDLMWQVELAFTGEQAIELMDAGRVFDLIVMDENLQDEGGVLTGTETTRLIRERELMKSIEGDEAGEKERALIFGFSGNCTPEDQARGRESGQDWFWAKPPPNSEQALQDVSRLWDKKSPREM